MARPSAEPNKKAEPIRLLRTATGEPQRNRAGELRYRARIDAGKTKEGNRRQVSKFFGSLAKARKWVQETRSAHGKTSWWRPTSHAPKAR